MRNLSAVAFVVWIFLIVPALCGAGLLPHACLCNEAQECSHEDLCAQDPCSTLSTRVSSSDQWKISDLIIPSLPLAASIVGMTVQAPVVAIAFESAPFPRNIPVPPADLPLLI